VITETADWRAAISADRRTSTIMAALSALVAPEDVPHLIELVRLAPTPVGTVAHGVLQRALGDGRVQLAREQLDAWTAAFLERNTDVLDRWRQDASDAALSAVYDRVVSVLFEGACFAMLLERLGTPATLDPGRPGLRGRSCHYASECVDVYLEADVDDRFVAHDRA